LALYRYKAVTPSGEIQEGDLECPAQAAVVERLQGMGLIAILVEESAARAAAAKTGLGWYGKTAV
jgi:type II secretory pathway component PulF